MKHKDRKSNWKILGSVLFSVFIAFWIGYGVKAVIDSSNTAKASTNGQKTLARVDNPPTRAELLKLVNAERAKHKAPPLVENAKLDKAAQAKADDMSISGHYEHECPDCLNGMIEAEKNLGLQGNYGENLNNHIVSSKEAVKSWISSKPHFEAMINSKYTLTGFGIKQGSYGKYVVEEFYSPQKFTTPTTKQFN